ncbi:MAG: RHS repeat-associated core domain-containing protein [Acidimicrobiales bacterium]
MPTLIVDGTTSYVGAMAATTGGDTTWNLTDRLGSVGATTDPTGDTAASIAYSAYGSIRGLDGPHGSVGYTGQHQDPTGLVHLRARRYAPALGRFLSADAVQPNADGTQGFNTHNYTGSNPTSLTDPPGHTTLAEYGAAAGRGALASGAMTSPVAFANCGSPASNLDCWLNMVLPAAGMGAMSGIAGMIVVAQAWAMLGSAGACAAGGSIGVASGQATRDAQGGSTSAADPTLDFIIGCAGGVGGGWGVPPGGAGAPSPGQAMGDG